MRQIRVAWLTVTAAAALWFVGWAVYRMWVVEPQPTAIVTGSAVWVGLGIYILVHWVNND